MKKSMWIVLVIILILIAIVIAFFYFNRKDSKEPIESMNNIGNIHPEMANEQTNKQEENNDKDNEIVNNEQINSEKPDNTSEHDKTTNSDLFGKYYVQAEELLNKMTLEEKVGQMFLVRYPESGVINQIKKYHPGGYILFGRDFENETKQSITKELKDCQNASKIKMILGVDEEGGTVVRVSAYKAFRNSKFKSPQALWQEGQLPKILEDSKEKSKLLKSLGLNMNLAPVADVPTKSSSFIYARSYGRGAEKTAIYVSELIKTMNSDEILSSMKHFPGYGDNVDTHTGIAIDNRKYSTFESSDFLPFESGIEAGAPTILVSHNIVKCMDKNFPASLSEKVHDILRDDLNFTGIILTDDLAMDAVKSYVENGEAAVQAVLAGNDMMISSDFVTQRNEVLKAVKDGEISETIINTAVKRILACKLAYDII